MCNECPIQSDNVHVKLMFDVGKKNIIDHNSWKEHLKISKLVIDYVVIDFVRLA